MNYLKLKPIGIIKTQFEEKVGVPIQPINGEEHTGHIELNAKYTQGLQDLNEFSHIHLLYHFNRHEDYSLLVKPYMDDTPRGIFATRAPKRPSQIGLSLVEIVKIEKNIITFKGVDILNNTPLLDIKPYYHDFDSRENSKAGWLDRAKNRRKVADDRF